MKLDLLTPGIEVGLVTTNLDAMVAFYEGFLELDFQGEIDFPGGSQRRYTAGWQRAQTRHVHAASAAARRSGGGRAQAGIRYFTIGVKNLRALSKHSPRPTTRWWSRSPSSHRFRAWAGCSSPIPTATGSNCSARCRHDDPAADADLLPAPRPRDVRAVHPLQPVHLPRVHARRRRRASVRRMREHGRQDGRQPRTQFGGVPCGHPAGHLCADRDQRGDVRAADHVGGPAARARAVLARGGRRGLVPAVDVGVPALRHDTHPVQHVGAVCGGPAAGDGAGPTAVHRAVRGERARRVGAGVPAVVAGRRRPRARRVRSSVCSERRSWWASGSTWTSAGWSASSR